jgi:hypothetical protein
LAQALLDAEKLGLIHCCPPHPAVRKPNTLCQKGQE